MMSSTNFIKMKMNRNESSDGFNFSQWQDVEIAYNS